MPALHHSAVVQLDSHFQVSNVQSQVAIIDKVANVLLIELRIDELDVVDLLVDDLAAVGGGRDAHRHL